MLNMVFRVLTISELSVVIMYFVQFVNLLSTIFVTLAKEVVLQMNHFLKFNSSIVIIHKCPNGLKDFKVLKGTFFDVFYVLVI